VLGYPNGVGAVYDPVNELLKHDIELIEVAK